MLKCVIKGCWRTGVCGIDATGKEEKGGVVETWGRQGWDEGGGGGRGKQGMRKGRT